MQQWVTISQNAAMAQAATVSGNIQAPDSIGSTAPAISKCCSLFPTTSLSSFKDSSESFINLSTVSYAKKYVTSLNSHEPSQKNSNPYSVLQVELSCQLATISHSATVITNRK